MRFSAIRLAVVAIAAGASGGCGFNFASPSVVVDRRILVIEVSPPEVIAGAALPPSVGVAALVVDPTDPSAQAAFEWRTCAVAATTNGGSGRGGGIRAGGGTNVGGSLLSNGASQSGSSLTRCDAIDSTTLVQSGSAALPALAVGAPFPAEVAAALLSPSISALPQMQVELRVDSSAGELYAVKAVTITGSLPPGQAPNTNPQIDSLQFDGLDWSASTPVNLAYGACQSGAMTSVTDSTTGRKVSVCSHSVNPVVDASQSQFYFTQLADGSYQNETERLRFSWFTDGGSFDHETTSQPAPGESAAPNGLATSWREPTSLQSPITLWVVVRDGRGGTSWQQREIVLQ
jgi:hypothetical protein